MRNVFIRRKITGFYFQSNLFIGIAERCAGKRALVCMKHVGMNVAADAFVNSAITGINGGLVVLAADDPSMHSSQNEQDSRFYGKFAMIPILEPSTQQEAYDMMAYAYQLSEETKLPVLMRVVTRLAHSRAGVVVREPLAQNGLNPETDRTHWVLLPANARRQYASLVGKQGDLLASSENSPYNHSELITHHSKLGVIACGIGYNYLMENFPNGCPYPVLKIGQYPLPRTAVETLLNTCNKVLVLSEKLSYLQLFCKMSYNPARLYGLNAGYLAEGAPADLVVFDPERVWNIDKFASKSQNSPFINENLTGKIELTMSNGKIVFSDWK